MTRDEFKAWRSEQKVVALPSTPIARWFVKKVRALYRWALEVDTK